MAYRPEPKPITLGPFYDQLTGFVDKYDGGLEIYIHDAEGNLLPVENAYMNEEGGRLKVVIKQAVRKK